MEPIPQFRIEGIEEALASFAMLGQAIDRVTQSSRLATEALAGVVPSGPPSLPFGDNLESFSDLTGAPSPLSESISQALSATLIPDLDTLDDDIANALSGVLLPDLKGALGAISDASSTIEQATTALTDAVATMTKAVEGFKLPPSQVLGLSPEQLSISLGELQSSQSAWQFVDAASLAGTLARSGLALVSRFPIAGPVGIAAGAAVMGHWLYREVMDDSLYNYDEEASERMNLVRGFPDIATLEDGWILSKEDKAYAQKRGFLAQVEFFSAKLKELDEKANADVTPLLDEPAELFEREQARALRDLYSKLLLELVDRAKLAGGVGVEKFDADALAIAQRSAEQSVDQITPVLSAPPSAQLITFEPIKIDIKVLSDHPLSIRTDNPNPNIDLSWDFYAGPRMR